eukprot:366278-Chlamydomonas_euryale.AAC.10
MDTPMHRQEDPCPNGGNTCTVSLTCGLWMGTRVVAWAEIWPERTTSASEARRAAGIMQPAVRLAPCSLPCGWHHAA